MNAKDIIFTVLFLAAPRIALACPVCFGETNAPMAVAAKMGVIFMLGVLAVVLTAFAAFFIYLMRRARLVSTETGPAKAGMTGPAKAGHYLEGQEGIAQC